MSYWTRLGNATSQWFNTLSGGNPDIPMSARVGYYVIIHHSIWYKKNLRFFVFVERVIDTAFYPIDGPAHCYNAYLSDADEDLRQGSIASFAFLCLFSVVGSLCIMPVTWLYFLVKRLLKSPFSWQ